MNAVISTLFAAVGLSDHGDHVSSLCFVLLVQKLVSEDFQGLLALKQTSVNMSIQSRIKQKDSGADTLLRN